MEKKQHLFDDEEVQDVCCCIGRKENHKDDGGIDWFLFSFVLVTLTLPLSLVPLSDLFTHPLEKEEPGDDGINLGWKEGSGETSEWELNAGVVCGMEAWIQLMDWTGCGVCLCRIVLYCCVALCLVLYRVV